MPAVLVKCRRRFGLKTLFAASFLLALIVFSSAFGTVGCETLTATLASNAYLPTSSNDSATKCNALVLHAASTWALDFGGGDASDVAYLCVGNATGQAQIGDVFYYKNSVYAKSAIGAPYFNYGPNKVKIAFNPANVQPQPVSPMVPNPTKPAVFGIPEYTTADDGSPRILKFWIGGTETSEMSFVPVSGLYIGAYGEGSDLSIGVGEFFRDGFISWRGTKVTGATPGPTTSISLDYPQDIKYAYASFYKDGVPNPAYQMKTYIGGYLDRDVVDDRHDDVLDFPMNEGLSLPFSLTKPEYAGRLVTPAEAPDIVKVVVFTDPSTTDSYNESEKFYFYSQNSFDEPDAKLEAHFLRPAYEAVFEAPLPVCTSSYQGQVDCPPAYKTDAHNVSVFFLGEWWNVQSMTGFDESGGGESGIDWVGMPKVILQKGSETLDITHNTFLNSGQYSPCWYGRIIGGGPAYGASVYHLQILEHPSFGCVDPDTGWPWVLSEDESEPLTDLLVKFRFQFDGTEACAAPAPPQYDSCAPDVAVSHETIVLLPGGNQVFATRFKVIGTEKPLRLLDPGLSNIPLQEFYVVSQQGSYPKGTLFAFDGTNYVISSWRQVKYLCPTACGANGDLWSVSYLPAMVITTDVGTYTGDVIRVKPRMPLTFKFYDDGFKSSELYAVANTLVSSYPLPPNSIIFYKPGSNYTFSVFDAVKYLGCSPSKISATTTP
ncbi:MAG: hypothetical protein V1834_01755, partial [Candidatus Micrarchaeota archaeon]